MRTWTKILKTCMANSDSWLAKTDDPKGIKETLLSPPISTSICPLFPGLSPLYSKRFCPPPPSDLIFKTPNGLSYIYFLAKVFFMIKWI